MHICLCVCSMCVCVAMNPHAIQSIRSASSSQTAETSTSLPSWVVPTPLQHSVANDKAQHLGILQPFTYFIVFCCLFYGLLRFSLTAKLLPITYNDMMSVRSFICHLAPNLLTNCCFLFHDSRYCCGCSARFHPGSCWHYGMLKV